MFTRVNLDSPKNRVQQNLVAYGSVFAVRLPYVYENR